MLKIDLTNYKRSNDDASIIALLPDGVTMKGNWYKPATLAFVSKYVLDATNEFVGFSKDLRKLPSYQDAVTVIHAVLEQVHGISVTLPILADEDTAVWTDIHNKYLEYCANNELNTDTYTVEQFVAREVA